MRETQRVCDSVVQQTKEYALLFTFAISTVAIGLAQIQSRDSGRADCSKETAILFAVFRRQLPA